MSAMVDKGGGGRDVLKAYNPPPSYASVLSGRRAQQSFFGGSTPPLPKRNSVGSRKELGRREKLSSESVGTEAPSQSSSVVPSISHPPSASTSVARPAKTAPRHGSTTPNQEHADKMEQSPAYTPKVVHEDQKGLPGHAVSSEKRKPDGFECESSRPNPGENPSLCASNMDHSGYRKTYSQENRNPRGRDEQNERRIWSPSEHSQRRSYNDNDEGRRGQYMGSRSANIKYRSDAKPLYDNLKDKENQNNSEKRKTFLPDQDGWLTKVPIQKKAKNEKPFQPAPNVTRFGEVQRYSGQQRPVGGPRPFQQGRGRDSRREYQGGRQTIVYSNSRGSAFGRGQSTRGVPQERNFNTSASRRNEMGNFASPPTTISASLSSTSAIITSVATSVTAVPPRSTGFLPQPIVITSTIVCRPDLTPPPPPACGTFSYRDILTKGIQSPPSPVQIPKTEQLARTERENSNLTKVLDTNSEASEINVTETVQHSSEALYPSPTSQAAKENPSDICTAPISIPPNHEEIVDQNIDASSHQSLSIANDAVTYPTNENAKQSAETGEPQIQQSFEMVTDTTHSATMPRTDSIQFSQTSPGPPPGLTKCSSVETSLMFGAPPGFQEHILQTSRMQQSDGSNSEFGVQDFKVSTMSSTLGGNVITAELAAVQESMVNQSDHEITNVENQTTIFSRTNYSEIGDAPLPYSCDSMIQDHLQQEQNKEQNLICQSENIHSKASEPPIYIANTSEISGNIEMGEQEQNHAPAPRLNEEFNTEYHESSQLFVSKSSSTTGGISDGFTFQVDEIQTESSTPAGTQNSYEDPNPSLNRRPSPKKLDSWLKIDEEKKEEPVYEFAMESKHNCEVIAIESERNGNESESQPNEPLGASELLQQIHPNRNIFSKKGLILNKVQENLSFPRNKKNERAPAPPPTPNDDSYSGGWGSTPVDDTDPEGSPFHLITSAAKELEHSITSNPTESEELTNIGSKELKDKARSEHFGANFETTSKENENLKSEIETIQYSSEKSVVSGSCSNFSTDSKTINEHDAISTKSPHSSPDTNYNVAIEQDLNIDNTDACNVNLSENEQKLQEAIGEDLKKIQRAVQPIVIKPMRKLEAYFPNASQTWTAVSEDEPKKENTEALPRRVPKTKFRSNDSVPHSSVETEEYNLDTQEVSVEKMPENISNNLENKYEIRETTMVQEIEQSPAGSKREWLKDDHSSMSPDIYSSMNADGSSPKNQLVNSTSLSENIPGFNSEIQASLPSTTNDIWSTNQGKPNLTLPKSNLLTMERPEVSPLETLLKQSSTTSINLSVNYFKDTNSKVSKTVQSPIPLTSVQLLTTTVTTPKEQISRIGSSSDSNYNAVAKVPGAANQPGFIGTIPSVGQPTISTNSQEFYQLIQPGSNMLSGRSPSIPSGIPSLMQTQNLNPYPHPSPLSLPSQMNIQPQDMEYQHLSRMNSGPQGSLTQQPPHLNYVQPPPAAPMQYPNMFDPRWSNNYSMDVNQPEWLNINRFPSGEREFARPPQLHPLSQPVNIFNYPPPSMPPPKEGMFPNFNYPPPPFQPGYRLQALPGFLQRPPPPLPPQYNSGYYNKPRNSPSLRPPLRESPNRGDQSFGNMRQKLDGDRIRQPSHLQNQYHDMGNKRSPNESYNSPFRGGSNMNSEHNGRYDPNHGNKLQRPGPSRQPHDPTLADYIPRNLDPYNKDQAAQETSFNSSWKQRNLFSEKRPYGGSGRRNFKPPDQKEGPYPPLPSSDAFSESENQPGGSRRKNTFKGPLSTTEPAKGSKPQLQETKPSTPVDYHKHEKPPMQMQYSNPNDVFMPGQAYPGLLPPPLEFGSNPIAFGYPDNGNDPTFDKVGNSVADYTGGADRHECDESQLSQLSHGSSPFDVQDFCSGGWKYYHETITSPSGLRIHQSTYVPYPNPCGSMTTAYLSTNDVRARIQWLGFKKAHELYTAKINAQRSLRMDVTVVCSKGGAVCCNSDILGTCSAYFHDRLFGRTDEYITIFVNVPSTIMKHFLQMMSCGEVFVPINDVNEVIMKAPIYLNLNMC